MACVVFQWISTMSAAAALVFAYVAFAAQYRDCMAELGTGDALLNVTLPVMLMHPTLVAQLFNMVGQVYALLVSHGVPLRIILCPQSSDMVSIPPYLYIHQATPCPISTTAP